MFNAKPLEIIKAAKSLSTQSYVVTSRDGKQMACDISVYGTDAKMIEAIKSGEAGATSAKALALFEMIGGKGALEGLAKEITEIQDLVTIYDIGAEEITPSNVTIH